MTHKYRFFLLMVTFVFTLVPTGLGEEVKKNPVITEPHQLSIGFLKESRGVVEAEFEYRVVFYARFDLEDVRLEVSHSDGLELETEPELFEGSLRAGEELKWELKGTLNEILTFDDGRRMNPVLRVEGSYLYPKDKIKTFIEAIYRENREIRNADSLEHALEELESIAEQQETVLINEVWRA